MEGATDSKLGNSRKLCRAGDDETNCGKDCDRGWAFIGKNTPYPIVHAEAGNQMGNKVLSH